MQLMKKEGFSNGPKQIVAQVSERVRGVIGAYATGQLPQGETQFPNDKRHLHFRDDLCGLDESYL